MSRFNGRSLSAKIHLRSSFINSDIVPEDKNCQLLQPPKSSGKRKKRKKKKGNKATASTTPPENTDNPQTSSLPPEARLVSLLPPQSAARPPGQLPKLRATSKKEGERLASSGRRSRKPPKDSPSLVRAANKISGSGAPMGREYEAELSAQARETLRWDGVLEDPEAEERRMELYRANRRQRYISHREALLRESQYALRQTFPKESK